MIRQYDKFVPDPRNLGGKKNIDDLSRNHLLALINAKPSINTHKTPHKHVNKGHKSQKKILSNYNEYKEVHEAFRRVQQLKHGGVDQKKPTTFKRQNMISKRLPVCKDIVMQDHTRNIKSLMKRLNDVQLTHNKKVKNIKNLGPQNSNQSLLNQSARSFRPSSRKSSFMNQDQSGYDQQSDYRYSRTQQNYSTQNNNNNQFSQHQDDGYFDRSYFSQQSQQREFEYRSQPKKPLQQQYQPSRPTQPEEDSHKNTVMDYSQAQKFENENEEEDLLVQDQILDYTPNSVSLKDLSIYSQTNNLNQNKQQQQKQFQKRPQSAKLLQGMGIKYNIPFIKSNPGQDPYKELRRILLNLIMDKNLYEKRIILVDLPMAAKKSNPQLNREKIREICENICINLYGQL